MLHNYLFSIPLAAVSINALHVVTWPNEDCRSFPAIYEDFLGPTNGCQQRYQDRGNPAWDGQERSVAVQMVEGNLEDETQFVVFFSSDDCDPKTIINTTDDGCSSFLGDRIGEYMSWEIWDMCNGTVGCDLSDGGLSGIVGGDLLITSSS
ncbi:hypothetical protein P154DRAFT_229132 [Amniculicola lignicola CBS 123094]|uniref:Ecp2 effector protein domain-containing protein n=1 Tax=Amniculicola lignicola CBS 123094 TaxID=1392246 RepID=A0A6A5WNX7_9PLEO|nr:hypothetical protein P154DRAFT_229132 [Amniculicola lignicola CBS 123094]